MKKIFLSLTILFSLPAVALDMSDCLTDAESFGSHIHSITPNPACFDILKSETQRVEASSSDGIWKAYAYKHMLYLEKYSGATLVSRELLAGDQTQLKDVKKIHFDGPLNKLLLLQQGDDGQEYLSFNLDFVGNVSPKTFLDHNISNGAQSVSLSADGTEVKLHFSSQVKVYAATADSRYKDQRSECQTQILRTESP